MNVSLRLASRPWCGAITSLVGLIPFRHHYALLLNRGRVEPGLHPGERGGGLEKCSVHWHDVLMKNSTTEPMDASTQFCPNETCSARGKIGAGNIRIHSYQPQTTARATSQGGLGLFTG